MMTSQYPRFRKDLIIEQQVQENQTYFVIKDPITKRFFRFKTHEYTIASLLDGNRSLEEIQGEFEREFGVTLPREKLVGFIERLGELCFLESDLSEREISRRQRSAGFGRGLFGRLLYIKFGIFDPDRFLGAIMPLSRPLFRKQFAILTLILTLAALAISISNWGEYSSQVERLLRAGTIPMLFVAIFVVTFIHETAHGLTCKYYGGKVHDMGFLLIYLLPAFYCNVSDAWLFRSRSKKLLVSFAGMYVQILLWAMATIAWRVIDPRTGLSDFLCLVMAVTGLSTLFNLNPLIKLDGYYMLSDYLDLPNLRQRAFDFIGRRIRDIFSSRPEKGPDISHRNKKIYVLYGLVAGVYSIGLLVFLFGKMAGFILSRFGPTALFFVLFIAFIVFSTSMIGYTISKRGARRGGKGPNMKRRNKMIMWGVIVVILLVAIIGRWELRVSNEFILLPNSRVSIRAEVPGIIVEIHAYEGDTVRTGGLIARLDDTEYRSELEETGAEIAKWEAELQLLEKGPREEEIQRLQKLVDKAVTRVEFAEKEFARIEELYSKKMVASHEYESAHENLQVLRNELEHTESDLKLLTMGNRPETIQAAEAELERLRTHHEFLRQQVERTEIRTPISGIVATHRLIDRLKEHVDTGDEICQIVDCGTMLLEIPVSEKDVADVRISQKVKLKARAIPKKAFYGKVVSIAPVAAEREDRTVIIVTSRVDNPEFILKPGMTGNAKIYCGKKRFIYLWTRKIIRYIRVEFWF